MSAQMKKNNKREPSEKNFELKIVYTLWPLSSLSFKICNVL